MSTKSTSTLVPARWPEYANPYDPEYSLSPSHPHSLIDENEAARLLRAAGEAESRGERAMAIILKNRAWVAQNGREWLAQMLQLADEEAERGKP